MVTYILLFIKTTSILVVEEQHLVFPLSLQSNHSSIPFMKSLLLCSCLLFLLSCVDKRKEEAPSLSTEKKAQIDRYLKEEASNTLGMAVAVIKEGNLLYESYLGKENLEGKAVDQTTIFPVYSLSKLITATAIFQLIEENRLQLEDNLALYINNLPEEWKGIQIKHLLTHSSGLPDYNLMQGNLSDSVAWANVLQQALRFEKGERWEYNQTNFWILTQIIEKITAQSFEEFVVNNQFSASTTPILYSSNFIETLPNKSFKYSFEETTQQWKKVALNFGKRANSAGGLHLTLPQFVAWSNSFDNNEFIQAATKAQLWTPFDYKEPFFFESKQDQFLFGWQQYSSNNTTSYGFTGGLVTGYRKFIRQNMTIIILTNGLKGAPMHNRLLEHIAGLIEEDLVE